MRCCDQCHGTDAAEMCAQGQCYWEAEMLEQERWEQERREWEREEMDRHFREHPHG